MLAVSNTSPLSNLAVIGQLGLLQQQFGAIWIPAAVADELNVFDHEPGRQVLQAALAAGWLHCQPTANRAMVEKLSEHLDPGEAEAIVLALELHADRLLIDEKEGRAVAGSAGLSIVGVLGVLLQAKQDGHISAIKPHIGALRTKSRFFIAPQLEAKILDLAGE